MLTLKNVKNLSGNVHTVAIKSDEEFTLDGEGKLTIMPAIIDAQVHFCVPGAKHKEDWKTGARAAIAGGITTVFDMPDNTPITVNKESLAEKRKEIDAQLGEVKIPLRYHLFLAAHKDHLTGIGPAKSQMIGIKVYLSATAGNLLLSETTALERVFQLCAQENIVLSLHPEDAEMIRYNQGLFRQAADPAVHSKIYDRNVAAKGTQKAIELAEKYGTVLCLMNVSTRDELELIKGAKKAELLVFAGTTPQHLFLTEKDYEKWGTKVQIDPPIRPQEDQDALWKGIQEGVIDFITSDHSPHLLNEKKQPYGQAPSGIPSIETMLPLLLNAYHEGKISLEQIVKLTRVNIEDIFTLPHHDDVVLVDLEKVQEVRDERLKTKCGWSPFSGRILKGWPIFTVLKGKVYNS